MFQQPHIDKIDIYAKHPYEAKYQFLINKRQSTGLNHFNNSKAFFECSNDIEHISKKMKNTTYIKKRKKLIVLNHCVKSIQFPVFELNAGKHWPGINPYFQNFSTVSFFMKTWNKRVLQQISFNYSSDIEFQEFTNLYKKCTVNPYPFLVTDATLGSDNT